MSFQSHHFVSGRRESEFSIAILVMGFPSVPRKKYVGGIEGEEEERR